MGVDQAEFRRVMGHWSSGVAIASSRTGDGRPRGLTVNSLTSVSLQPPLVLVCLDRSSETFHCILEAGSYAVSILEASQEPLARSFSGVHGDGKFEGVPYRAAVTGSPVLEDALAWLDCRLEAAHEAGDHHIFVGEVVAAGARAGEPLLFFRGGFAAG
jgi:3-hydroxy-9,10-secoandrosta-1,3,5(10)-triene-9,17-dione monooxygenase reductase component